MFFVTMKNTRMVFYILSGKSCKCLSDNFLYWLFFLYKKKCDNEIIGSSILAKIKTEIATFIHKNIRHIISSCKFQMGAGRTQSCYLTNFPYQDISLAQTQGVSFP